MSALMNTMKNFSSAEEFLDFLGVEYVPQIVHVNRLHILKRFQQYLAKDPISETLPESAQRKVYKQCLEQAYGDFVISNAVTEKVFKVFQDKQGVQTVSVNKLKETLSERHG